VDAKTTVQFAKFFFGKVDRVWSHALTAGQTGRQGSKLRDRKLGLQLLGSPCLQGVFEQNLPAQNKQGDAQKGFRAGAGWADIEPNIPGANPGSAGYPWRLKTGSAQRHWGHWGGIDNQHKHS
jgi:hypothetical protein